MVHDNNNKGFLRELMPTGHAKYFKNSLNTLFVNDVGFSVIDDEEREDILGVECSIFRSCTLDFAKQGRKKDKTDDNIEEYRRPLE